MTKENKLVDNLLEKGNLYKLKCIKCKETSIQISNQKQTEFICLECGSDCEVIK